MIEAAELEIPEDWEKGIPEHPEGTLLVLGATDTGKSSLVRWLVRRCAAAGLRTGWLDGDIGQATLGVPGAMGLALADRERLEPAAADRLFFIGAASPRGNMLAMLTGVRRLRDRALEAGAGLVVVDTTGLVAAEAGGAALKQGKIEILEPRTVVALQRDRELEHLLGPLRREPRLRLVELPVASAVRRRSPEERAERRRRRLRDYFSVAAFRRLEIEGLPVYGLDRAGRGRLLGLQDPSGDTLALGVLEEIEGSAWKVRTPLEEASGVTGVRVGELRIDPASGNELD